MTTEILDEPVNVLALKFNASKSLIEELSAEIKSLKEKRDTEEAELSRLDGITARHDKSLSPVDFLSRVEYEKAIQQSIASDRFRLNAEINISVTKINITIRDINTKTLSIKSLKNTHELLTRRVEASQSMWK